MKIGLDVMGGDYAPEKTVEGAILALKDDEKLDIKVNELLKTLKR